MRQTFYDENVIGPWVCQRTGGQYFPDCGARAIGLVRDGNLVAGVLFEHYNGRSIAMHVAGEGRDWMTRDFLMECFRYPFVQLGVHKIIGLVDSSNRDARRLDEHLGFHMEAKIAGAAPRGDLMVYTMTREQCRFLDRKVANG